jgi:hypothetical protein
MRILLINPGHPSIGSRIPDEHLPPLGLLSVGGPLIDDGHDMKLLDAEFGPLPLANIVAEVLSFAPDALLVGHSGSTCGIPVRSRSSALSAGRCRVVRSSMAACSRPIIGARCWPRCRRSTSSCAAKARRRRAA